MAKWLYRIASILLVLFSVGHTLGFRKLDPGWGVDALVQSMKTIRFSAQGFPRTYWDFYVGFGLFVSVLLFFSALVCWQLGALDASTLRLLLWLRWSLALCFAVVTFLSWKYFFPAPVVFSVVITLCLVAAAWLAQG